ncbi:MAG: zinc-binding alcohol dehydrogenase family protein [Phycisphaerales bacterium]|nr:zinc-binding alcohol dehydrogenase family protein [Phycisphaerales bacterium]
MKAAVVTSFDHPPRLREVEAPTALEDEVIVTVRATALSQLVRAQASGKHYSSGTVPMVPGTDGVGLLPSGQRVYFAFPRRFGAMAEAVAVPAANIVMLPGDLDDITAAAIANPGMSSWAALTERAAFQRGESVLINGANGTSGRLAIQIAKHLEASRVIATARNTACETELRALGADDFVALQQAPDTLVADFRRKISQGVDIVLDYLWGSPAEAFLKAATGHGESEAAPRLRFVNIGSLAGASINFNAGTLRSSGLELQGSGLGSLSHAALIRAIAGLMQAVKPAGLTVDTMVRPLSEVESVWTENSEARFVFTVSKP